VSTLEISRAIEGDSLDPLEDRVAGLGRLAEGNDGAVVEAAEAADGCRSAGFAPDRVGPDVEAEFIKGGVRGGLVRCEQDPATVGEEIVRNEPRGIGLAAESEDDEQAVFSFEIAEASGESEAAAVEQIEESADVIPAGAALVEGWWGGARFLGMGLGA